MTAPPSIGSLIYRRRLSLRWMVLLLNLGVIVGLIWAYLITPPVIANVAPSRMHLEGRDQWIRMIAFSYHAGAYDEHTTLRLLYEVEKPGERVQHLLTIAPADSVEEAALRAIEPIAYQAGAGTYAPATNGIAYDLFILTLPMLLISSMVVIVIGGWRMLTRFREH